MSFLNQLFKKEKLNIDLGQLPNHVAIIMDGNGRWAKKRGLPRNVGHREGSNALRKIVEASSKLGIKHLTVYAFSTENWKRPKNEVDALMSLLLEYLKNAERELSGKNVRIRVIGNIKGLPEDIQKEVARVEKLTAVNSGLSLNMALNYGSRDEILQAIKGIAKEVENKTLCVENIDENTVARKLYTSEIPDPDLLIRTSGEKRISNFLLWQLAYTEFYYTDVLWPDFREKHLIEAVREYQSRHRRFGGI
ncbi:MAG: isoprenyl transferase [Clostridia bacterium]|nr:isoprenyl transferase [Clostridia bacterium]